MKCRSEHRRRRPSRGFSLVELMVVLVILGLLIGLVMPNLWARAELAKVQAAETQIKMYHNALQTYRLDIGRYPSTEQGLLALMEAPADVAEYWKGPYLSSEIRPDPWHTPYRYQFPANNLQGVALYSLGEDKAVGGEGNAADIGLLPDKPAETS